MQHAGPRTLAPTLWVVERPFKLPIVRAEVGTRMTIIRLNDGNLFLHSPVKLDSELKRALNALGPVGAVVAPNRAHHLFVRDYIESYPQAMSYGAPGLPERRPDLRLDATLGDEAPREWQGVIEQQLFRGAPPLNEVVFFHPSSRTVIFTDLIFNLPAEIECRCAYVLLALGSARTFRAASLGASTCDPRSDRGPSLGRYHSPLGLRPRNHVSRRRTRDWRPRAYSVGLCISLRFASWPKLANVKSRCLFLAVLR
jgi:hypothetical protein